MAETRTHGHCYDGRLVGRAGSTVCRTYTDRNHIRPKAEHTVMFPLKTVFFELLLFCIVNWRCHYFYDSRGKALMCIEGVEDRFVDEGGGRQLYVICGCNE